jgi:hypothetical protein
MPARMEIAGSPNYVFVISQMVPQPEGQVLLTVLPSDAVPQRSPLASRVRLPVGTAPSLQPVNSCKVDH